MIQLYPTLAGDLRIAQVRVESSTVSASEEPLKFLNGRELCLTSSRVLGAIESTKVHKAAVWLLICFAYCGDQEVGKND